MHASMQKMVLIAKVFSTRLLNFVKSKVVIYQNGKVICKKGFVHKPFLNPFNILCGGKHFYQATTLSGSPNKLRFLKNWCLWSVGLVQNIFSKVFTQNHFHNKTIIFIWLEMTKSSFPS